MHRTGRRGDSDEGVLPERIQEALGQLVGAAKQGLLALSVEVGLGVLRELLEQEVDELVGPKGKWNPDRSAVRHGHENGEVTLGGRRVPVKRPRARTVDGESELPLQTYEHFADRDALEEVVLERMLAGVSTRQYRRAQEPVGEQLETDARSTSKSAASRVFVARTRQQLFEHAEPNLDRQRQQPLLRSPHQLPQGLLHALGEHALMVDRLGVHFPQAG